MIAMYYFLLFHEITDTHLPNSNKLSFSFCPSGDLAPPCSKSWDCSFLYMYTYMLICIYLVDAGIELVYKC